MWHSGRRSIAKRSISLCYLGQWRLLHSGRTKAKEALEAAETTCCPSSFCENNGAVAAPGRMDRRDRRPRRRGQL
jgi:hypothetical protein